MRTPDTTTTPSTTTTKSAQRRHDLDALRAFAMLLGIALHAGLAFTPIPWLAMNKETSPVIGVFIEIVHGFRLPLFFIMSGYFSAMLLQRRGIGGFLGHRWKRIALPLLLGTCTIVPAMWGVIIGGHVLKEIVPAPVRESIAPTDGSTTIWRAAADGDLEAVQSLVQSGSAVDEPDGQFFTLPLAWAATGDHADIVEFLLESGADPNQRMGDDNTPMHTACFFGAPDSFALMLDAGGDPEIQNKHGETPIAAMRHEKGVVDFISNILGIESDFDQIAAGRLEIQSLIGDSASGYGPRPPALEIINGLLRGEIFMHLWFLWHLCWFAVALATISLLFKLLPWKRAPEILVSTPLCLLGLIPLTALTQSWQANFGPDTSAALLPTPHVLAHYAVFFGFGALMHNSARAADSLGRAWWAYLLIAAASGVIGLRLSHDPSAFSQHRLHTEAGEMVGTVLQAVFVWTASFGLIGIARKLLSKHSHRIRYISDSSYWLYITHLPFILAGQFALAYVPLPPMIEFMVLTIATTAMLLLCYHWFVRYTWIGRLLNGRRQRPTTNRQDQTPKQERPEPKSHP